ncbi:MULTISPECIES: polyribonucleotide nucleotidyltransferase [Mycolicibacterium]|jgi:polyribonucleotide nucleotidyltransferase|uniref:Polyribonucleotide nucleotidyltransferase n=1 Tax=Mycolicibacterium vanbaalenii (strain DSM 7251 / JCM 13017 / BCRC 16820 / KCTC 9966 / NRRL B-24157 / PYR-1) TaxID=350058 RepID=PNP_MYCVP|nr:MULTISPECIES: polyribonucleotide nucleotidyltransferase [Mycolicibacterium]A1T7L4.1 RecName: Full=Polyribonucleotide nucleotidyltransferase; AltName: Full=Polynucleotide phosphorylase; Short=PNPase [Mycolicibacterium vanbaalenii PYR-1]ABM13164.1 Polyribonucleotide nucleotidyltransferase [Mycolicibacterium vanbaalenii PYR-1]MDW5613172.1 polyribonucleotide nucleotidyltransferase [Mycolicibacterium sp. D5.8-2]PQP42740.1 polyribonucleotide nucleotidyltransferase [Mycolicibacterium austroafricanu
MSVVEIEDGVFESTATIDNGSFGTRTIRFEAGRLAQQAAGAVVAYLDDETMLLSATTASKSPKEHFDFFPLTIDVEERMYAAGRIPGSFFRREGRPSTDAILTCRLIDRPLRPSFVSGLRNEIQVVVTVLSLDPKDLYDVLAINAASASTQISGLPFSGPVGGVRVALIDGQWVAFPTVEQLERAVFDMVVAGRKVGDDHKDVAIMMVEAEATENVIELVAGGAGAPTETVVAEGLEAAKPFIAVLCDAQAALAGAAGKETAEYPLFPDYGDDVYYSVASVATEALSEALTIAGKNERNDRTDEIKVEVLNRLAEQYAGREKEIGAAYRSLTKKLVRQRILTDHFRIDGRGVTDIRALSAEVAVVPRAHGSALFERGETQIMGVTTLDMVKMAQQIDSLGPETSKRYMHHYNFPPYSTGETGRVGSPKRREIGHGALAERALVPVLPSVEEFPYAIRQVSEALGSNGSTSMGSVCASTLSLLNAGVPLKAPVAGIAMGLVSDDIEIDGKTERRFVTLTDILGAEDAFGDMDFKCAGTKDFVTALQLDTKLDGIPSQVLAGALAQAKDARITILEVMAEAIDTPDEMSPYAPRITTIKVPVDKIGEVIGPKGKMINSITEETGASISIEDDGTVFVGASNGEAAQAAIDKINAIANPQLPKVGERFLGTVVKTTDFGAFVSLLPGRDGLVHISKLGRGKRINKVEDVAKVGDKLRVEIADIDNRGKISLVLVAEESETAADAPADAPVDAATTSS